jgi:hypothetical protein
METILTVSENGNSGLISIILNGFVIADEIVDFGTFIFMTRMIFQFHDKYNRDSNNNHCYDALVLLKNDLYGDYKMELHFPVYTGLIPPSSNYVENIVCCFAFTKKSRIFVSEFLHITIPSLL